MLKRKIKHPQPYLIPQESAMAEGGRRVNGDVRAVADTFLLLPVRPGDDVPVC